MFWCHAYLAPVYTLLHVYVCVYVCVCVLVYTQVAAYYDHVFFCLSATKLKKTLIKHWSIFTVLDAYMNKNVDDLVEKTYVRRHKKGLSLTRDEI